MAPPPFQSHFTGNIRRRTDRIEHCHLFRLVCHTMLNPFAHDYTPVSAFLPAESSQIKTPPPKRKAEQPKKKQQPNATKLKAKVEPSPTTTTTTTTTTAAAANKGKQKDSQANSKKPQQQQRDSKNKSRNNKATQAAPISHATPAADLFAKESKFITIEAAIDPIRRIHEAPHANSLQTRRQSAHGDKNQFEHGYERYIDWIDRSLRLFDTVTLVGMDNAVVDIVSLVTILQDRKLGVHDDVETFSMDTGNNRITACIQVKLHSFY